jgi:hypothetical protein
MKKVSMMVSILSVAVLFSATAVLAEETTEKQEQPAQQEQVVQPEQPAQPEQAPQTEQSAPQEQAPQTEQPAK